MVGCWLDRSCEMKGAAFKLRKYVHISCYICVGLVSLPACFFSFLSCSMVQHILLIFLFMFSAHILVYIITRVYKKGRKNICEIEFVQVDLFLLCRSIVLHNSHFQFSRMVHGRCGPNETICLFPWMVHSQFVRMRSELKRNCNEMKSI